MSKQVIGIGSAPNDGLGDPFRTGWNKVNLNFSELYPVSKIGEITPSTITASQNNYAPTGWDDASYINISSDNSANKITGFAAPTATGKTIKTLYNAGTTVIPIPNDSDTGSTAANRVKQYSLQHNLHPGGSFTIEYNTSISRWILVADPTAPLWIPDPRKKFVFVTDCIESALTSRNSGTGATGAGDTYGIFGQKALGVWSNTTGTTTTGRSAFELGATAAITCALGRYVAYGRFAVSALSTVAEEYSCKMLGLGGYASLPSAETNGIFWAYERASDGDFLLCYTCNNSSRTKTVTAIAPSTNFINLAIITNDNWTAVEFLYSTDGLTWTRAALHTTNIPTTARSAPLLLQEIIKSAGTTGRLIYSDMFMLYYSFLRG